MKEKSSPQLASDICTVAMVSLGCPKNTEDAENILGQLIAEGFQITASPEQADAIIINTCGFLQSARDESMETVREMNQYRTNGRLKRLIIAGCMADKDRECFYSVKVDGFVSPFKLDQVVDVVAGRIQTTSVAKCFPEPMVVPASNRGRITSGSFAYIKIADGCNNHCSYCRIPFLRGPYRSKRMSDIINEAESLVALGVREVILISQDISRYGEDLNSGINLTILLQELTQISQLLWIRLLYLYPFHIKDDLLQVIAENSNICSYLDIPLQHVNEKVLCAMNRPGNLSDIRSFIKHIDGSIPGITLRSTFITGFPGEDQRAFEELKCFIREGWFDHLGVFVYSREPDTKAEAMRGTVSSHLAEQRRGELMSIQQAHVQFKHNKLMNSVVPVLVDGPDDQRSGWSLGRMETQAPEIDSVVHIKGEIPSGTFLPVKIVDTDPYDLYSNPLKTNE